MIPCSTSATCTAYITVVYVACVKQTSHLFENKDAAVLRRTQAVGRAGAGNLKGIQ